jgi:hypothetical protein
MESSSDPNKIQVSGPVAKRLMKLGYTYRGTVSVKVTSNVPLLTKISVLNWLCFFFVYFFQGKGEMETYWLENAESGEVSDDNGPSTSTASSATSINIKSKIKNIFH